MKDLIRRDENGALVRRDQVMNFEEALFSQRIIFLRYPIFSASDMPPIDHSSADTILTALLTLDSIAKKPIKLFVNSPGGSLRTTFLLCDTIRSLRSPVWTIGHTCASGAALILAAGEKGHRYIYERGSVMLHLPEGSFSGDAREVEVRAAEFAKVKDRMVDLLVDFGAVKKRTGILRDIDREYWMDAGEAIKYGLVDKVVTKNLLG